MLGVKEFSLLAMLGMMIMGLAGPSCSRLQDKWDKIGELRVEYARDCTRSDQGTPEQCVEAANEIRF